jgi:uncharacterized protein with gpF-like domain
MKSRPKTLKPIHPNVGIEIAYQKKLDALIEEMNRSVTWWVTAAYRANQPEMAQDANIDAKTAAQEIAKAIKATGSPAKVLENVMRKLSNIWQKRFDDGAVEMAKYFATTTKDRTDAALKSALKKSGMTVEFKMTQKMNDVMRATVGENVVLIKSIASEHLSDVQGLVMRSVAAGRDLGTLTAELQKRYAITKRRAALISRDQNNKMTANLTRVRQHDLGIKTAIWLHSGGGKEPRHDHLEANGKEYDIATGEFLDGFVLDGGARIFPGQLIGCRCVSRSVVPGIIHRKEL